MRDLKFKIAVGVILVLAIALLYLTVIGPQVQGYIVRNQIQGQLAGQQATVSAIMNMVNQQGYIVLSDEQNTVVLTRNPQLEAQLDASAQQVPQAQQVPREVPQEVPQAE
jgi:type II secretory pathway pseudopilin PulG